MKVFIRTEGMYLVTVSVTGVIGVTWDWIRVCVACIGVGVVRSQFHTVDHTTSLTLSLAVLEAFALKADSFVVASFAQHDRGGVAILEIAG